MVTQGAFNLLFRPYLREGFMQGTQYDKIYVDDFYNFNTRPGLEKDSDSHKYLDVTKMSKRDLIKMNIDLQTLIIELLQEDIIHVERQQNDDKLLGTIHNNHSQYINGLKEGFKLAIQELKDG